MHQEREQQLDAAAKLDMEYLRLLAACRELEAEYVAVTAALPEAHRDIIDRYISLCEELEYRRTYLALEMGK